MMLFICFLHQLALCQWTSQSNSLYEKQIYGTQYYQIEGWFNNFNIAQISPFITCISEAQSLIYLNGADTTKNKAYYYVSSGSYPQGNTLLTLDLYFTKVWISGTVSLALGLWSTTITYTNPTSMPFTGGFCDSLTFNIQSYSFVLPPNQSGIFTIIIVAPSGFVGIRNFHTSQLRCHYSCRTCSGSNDNQCLSCFSGIAVNSGKCSSCPLTAPYINLLSGCQNYCDQSYIRDSNNVCQGIYENFYSADYFYSNQISIYDRVWSQIYDPQHLDGASKENICYNYFYGPFTTTAGTFRSINLPSGRQFPVRIKLSLIILGQLQENSRIQVKFNNQYVGSLIYFNSQYIQDNVIIIYNSFQNLACMNYPSYSELTLLLTIPAAPSGTVLFTIVGQLSQSTLEAWGIRSSLIFMGRCSSYCVSCDETNYCLTCQSTYFTLYQGQCYYQYSCPISIGFVNSSYLCEAYESHPYSNTVFKGFYEFTPFEGMNSVFTLLNQTGINFMKGTNNYTSYTYSKRIFGGPYVWAQAAFQAVFSLPNPHYAASVHFTIIFGSNFTLGNFSYQIESNPVITLGKSNCTLSSNQIGDSNLEYMYQVHSVLPTHTINILNLIIHCYGDSNSVQYAYCGIQDLFIVEHQCQPYCLACTSPSDCTSWNATYDSSIIKFDGSTCLSNQYFNRFLYKCLDCPSLCPTCRTFEQCLSCISTFSLFNYQCVCQITQYLDSVNPPQCLGIYHQYRIDCQQPCLTCTSLNYCTDCYSSQVRVPQNGVCECATNYYEEVGNLVCQPCNKYCTECNGPDNGQCMDCIQLTNFILDSGTCRCQDNFYYSQATKVCEACHYSCQMCYDNQYNNCLSCSLAHQRTLVGLKCPCKMGFYEATPVSACSACPAVVDPSLLDCYKLCGDGSSVWFDGICPPVNCVTGYENQLDLCIPICGDSLVVAGEDCDDANSIQFDGCHNCGFQCSSNCLTCDAATIFPCDDICGDGIISGTEECDDGNVIPYDGCFNCLYQCQLECTNCIKGLCYECSTYGWKVNTIDLTCIENCGDSIVVNREQCDDYNTNPEDGCHNCRFQCRSDCLECDSTGHVCLKCLPGFTPYSYYCNYICGDGKIVSSSFSTEQCDDFNTINNDGCSSYCQFQCQPKSICLTCNSQQKCQSCTTGYVLNLQKNKCEELCGDNLLIGTENCEDLNNRMYDGCYKCRYQCQKECFNCSLGVCIQCKTGYFLNKFNKQCSPICGDKLIVSPEQCDDGNLIFDDGCHNCQFSCQDSCMHCLNGKCFICREGYYLNSISQCKPICGDNLTVPNEECEYSDQSLLDNCHQCKLTCSIYCKICSFGVCLECLPQNEIDPISKSCQPSIVYLEVVKVNCLTTFQNECLECAEGLSLNNISNECLVIKYQNQSPQDDFIKQYNYDDRDQLFKGGQQCVNDNVIIFDGQILNCQSECLVYYDSICYECNNEIGWYLNAFGFCEPFCGDKIVIHPQEVCDDGNEVQYDGCFECQLDCQIFCTQCLENVCYECNTPGWYLADDICKPVCGDGLLVYSEQCDDGNDEQYDGCSDCQFQCEKACSKCVDGVCFDCVAGWEINPINICQGICGDSIIAHPKEECDDGNYQKFDGCYECKFQCEELCTTCIDGECFECNNLGWQINDENHKCEPICNDGLIMGLEECDDMNQIPYDGCFECKFQCHKSCLQCDSGICLKCDYGYTTYLDQCESFCGDGQMSDLEECDDGNMIDVDGCSSECKIEENWACITGDYEVSTCFYSKLSKLELSLLEKNLTDVQIVSLKFDTKMQMISKDVQPQFSLKIHNLQETDYQVLLSPVIPLTTEPQLIEYNLSIYFNISVYRPILTVAVSNVTNEHLQIFNTFEGKIYLRDSEVMSEGEKKAMQAASSFSLTVIYTMIGITVLAILTGSMEMVWNLLDMVQFISYVKYVNIDFPLNLDTYFEVFKLISISPLLKYMGVNTILAAMNDGVAPFVKTINKFKEDEINAYFLSNYITFLLCIILAYFNYLVSIIISKYLYQMKPWALRRINVSLLKIFHKIRIYFRKNVQGFYYSVIIRIFFANYYEVMFATCIQITNLNWNNVNMAINSGLAILVLVGQAYFIFCIASKLASFTAKTTVCNKTKYHSMFEGVKVTKINFWGTQLNAVLLLKKFIFMVIIVNCQGDGAIQTIYLSLSSTMYLTYIFQTQPFESKFEFIKQIINELIISGIALSFLIYKYKRCLQLNQLAPDNFNTISKTIIEYLVSNHELAEYIAQRIIEKSQLEPKYRFLYTKLCAYLVNDPRLQITAEQQAKDDKLKKGSIFKKALLNGVQDIFEGRVKKLKEDQLRIAPDQKESFHIQRKNKIMGNVRFIGDLYLQKILPQLAVQVAIRELLQEFLSSYLPDGDNLEESLEGLIELLDQIGPQYKVQQPIDAKQQMQEFFNGQAIDKVQLGKFCSNQFSKFIPLDNIFQIFDILKANYKLSSRLIILYENLLDRKRNGWKEIIHQKGENAKSVKQLQDEYEKEQDRLSSSSRSHGGKRQSQQQSRYEQVQYVTKESQKNGKQYQDQQSPVQQQPEVDLVELAQYVTLTFKSEGDEQTDKLKDEIKRHNNNEEAQTVIFESFFTQMLKPSKAHLEKSQIVYELLSLQESNSNSIKKGLNKVFSNEDYLYDLVEAPIGVDLFVDIIFYFINEKDLKNLEKLQIKPAIYVEEYYNFLAKVMSELEEKFPDTDIKQILNSYLKQINITEIIVE